MDKLVKLMIEEDDRDSMSIYLREISILMEQIEMLKEEIKELKHGKRN
jgi:hypothetical protein|tara:strand:+ start:456 stop:599 length:144 start_codon:yes stop_codon:yes gene_type:complete